MAALQGDWVAVSYAHLVPGPWGAERTETDNIRVRVDGDRMVISRGAFRYLDYAFRLDGSKRPGWIDFQRADREGRFRGHWGALGLYRLEGDTLTVFDGSGRPQDFSTDDLRPRRRLFVLKRVKR